VFLRLVEKMSDRFLEQRNIIEFWKEICRFQYYTDSLRQSLQWK